VGAAFQSRFNLSLSFCGSGFPAAVQPEPVILWERLSSRDS